MPDTLSPRARSRTARARAATHNPVRPVRSHRWSALRSPRVSRSGPARRPPFFMRCRVSHGWATLGSNFRDTALDRVRAVIRARHYSRRTEGAYVAWIRRYILFHDKRHPTDMGAPEITRFLSSLAVEGNVERGQEAGDLRSEEHTLNSSHSQISYAVFCLKKKKKKNKKSKNTNENREHHSNVRE